MEEIIMLPEATTIMIAEASTRAMAEGRAFRICTGRNSTGAWVKWKVGEGMWTPPHYSAGF